MYPTLIRWPIEISTFGVMLALGFLVAGEVLARIYREQGKSRDDAWTFVFWCALGGILGAKLWYVAEQVTRGEPGGVSAFLLSRGGITWYGGFVGGVLAGALTARRQKHSWLDVSTAAAPAAAIGQAIGRIGCFLVGDDYGRPTDSSFGVAFPRGLPPTDLPVHPTMLYEAAWLIPCGVLLFARRKRSPFLFAEYLVLAGVGRAAIEGLRLNPALIGPLSNAQVFGLLCALAGGIGWLYARSRGTAAASVRPKPA